LKKYSSDKDINNLVSNLCKLGWRYISRKKHGILLAPNGLRLAVPSTPSDWRAVKNFSRDIKSLSSKERLDA